MPGEPIENRQNLAISAPFEPGSVFKVITLSAAMEKTKLTPSTPIFCGNGVITLFKRVIHDAHPHGTLSVQEVLEKSSNIGAIQIGLQVGEAESLRLREALRIRHSRPGFRFRASRTAWCGRSRSGSRARSARWPWDTKCMTTTLQLGAGLLGGRQRRDAGPPAPGPSSRRTARRGLRRRLRRHALSSPKRRRSCAP